MKMYGKIFMWLLSLTAFLDVCYNMIRFSSFSLALPSVLLYWRSLLNEPLVTLLCYMFSMWSNANSSLNTELGSLLSSSAYTKFAASKWFANITFFLLVPLEMN